MLEELPTIISSEANEDLKSMPIKKKVQKTVMGLNRNSVGGSDGMTGAF